MHTIRETKIHSCMQALRRAELQQATVKLPPCLTILELGGNDGYQASLLTAQGHKVISIDLPQKPNDFMRGKYHPVQSYQGSTLPFPDQSFDLVFSSNTLEHVETLDILLGETFRVLRTGGQAIHILPTVSWRFWACLGYIPFQIARTLKRLALRLARCSSAPLLEGDWRGLFMEKPHGAFSSVWQEFLTYRESWWKRQFQAAGFEVVSTRSTGLFYTPYFWFPWLPLGVRRGLAPVLGSSCRTYFLQRPDHRACP